MWNQRSGDIWSVGSTYSGWQGPERTPGSLDKNYVEGTFMQAADTKLRVSVPLAVNNVRMASVTYTRTLTGIAPVTAPPNCALPGYGKHPSAESSLSPGLHTASLDFFAATPAAGALSGQSLPASVAASGVGLRRASPLPSQTHALGDSSSPMPPKVALFPPPFFAARIEVFSATTLFKLPHAQLGLLPEKQPKVFNGYGLAVLPQHLPAPAVCLVLICTIFESMS